MPLGLKAQRGGHWQQKVHDWSILMATRALYPFSGASQGRRRHSTGTVTAPHARCSLPELGHHVRTAGKTVQFLALVCVPPFAAPPHDRAAGLILTHAMHVGWVGSVPASS